MTGKKLISLFGPMYLLQKKAVLDECSEKYPKLKSELNEVIPKSERGLKTFLADNVIDFDFLGMGKSSWEIDLEANVGTRGPQLARGV
jgi:hypothetical protein